jgi:hypothetical protein
LGIPCIKCVDEWSVVKKVKNFIPEINILKRKSEGNWTGKSEKRCNVESVGGRCVRF